MTKLIACFVFALGLTACGGQQSATPKLPAGITVGPNVQVSKQNAELAHGEALIAADPVNPDHLIACSGVWLLRARSFPFAGIREVAYVTTAGGQSWTQTKLTHVGAFDLDPVCEIGFNQVAYVGGASAFRPRPGHDWLARSNDGGLHWAAPTLFPWGDRDYIAVDKTNSRFHGRLYDVALNAKEQHGKETAPLGEIRSESNGATYLPSVRVYANPEHHGEPEYFSGPVIVLRNGDVMEVAYAWPDAGSSKRIVTFLSKDGGATFGNPQLVASRTGSKLIGTEDFKEEGASVLPLMAADDSNGPFKNRVYVIWQDFTKSAFGAASYPAPQATIMLAYSDDEGKKWSPAVEADDAPAWPARQYPVVFAPTIAVNNRGIVAVAWFDGRDLPDGTGGSLRMAASTDGGETFAPSFAVASAPSVIDPGTDRVTLEIGTLNNETHFLTDLRYHVFGQDTQGLVADAAGRFHPLWVDNRTGTAQLWTDTVSVAKTPIRNGDPSLSQLADVSKSVDLEVIGGTYDRRSQDVTADAAIVNTSKHAISGPIRMRLTSLTSQLGQPELQGADNGTSGPGATLTFVPPSGTSLAPKAESKPVHLVFHIVGPHPVTSADVVGGSINYVSLQYHAYAAPQATSNGHKL